MGKVCSCFKEEHEISSNMDFDPTVKYENLCQQQAQGFPSDLSELDKSIQIVNLETTMNSASEKLKRAVKGYLVRKQLTLTILQQETPQRIPFGYQPYQRPIDKAVPKSARKIILSYWECSFKQEKTSGVTFLPEMQSTETGEVYRGEWDQKDRKHGFGRLVKTDGSMYLGFFSKNQFEGQGMLVQKDGVVYTGEFKKGKAHGFGKITYSDQSYYEGEFFEDQKNGKGKEVWADGTVYEGDYKRNFKEGKGKISWRNGSFYEGDFKEDEFEGKGKYCWENTKTYCGDWKEGKKQGKGKLDWPDGRVYVGEFQEDKKHGYGIYRWDKTKEYKGPWYEGKQHGEGYYSFRDSEGNLVTKRCVWVMGEMINE